MKKILFILLFFPLFSCNDWLDVESEVSVTYRNYFKSEQDIENIYISILGKETRVATSDDPFDWASLYCDGVPSNVNDYRNLTQSSFSSSDNFCSWKNFYQGIYFVNMLEENRHRFENISEERADYWIAQASFAKGLFYFEIARRWGDAPIAPSTEDTNPRAKSPVDSVLAEAIRAAEAALILPTHDQLTDANGNSMTTRQYASIGSVRTLLANIYAWLGGLHGDDQYWERAEKEASFVIDGEAGFYDLVSVEDLVENTLGSKRDVTEVIFTIEKENKDMFYQYFFDDIYPGMNLISYPYSTTNPQDVDFSRNAPRISVASVKRLYPEEADLRRKEFWLNLGEVIMVEEYNDETDEVELVPFMPTYAYINKWRKPIYSVNPDLGERVLLAMDGNRVYWRLADLILLRAECRAHLGDPGAVDDLDRIRERAGLGKYTGATDKKTLLREIFDERDRELFGETCRYYDIVRNGYFRELLYGNYRTLTDDDVKNGALYHQVHSGSFSKNPLMKQNIYWSWYLQY